MKKQKLVLIVLLGILALALLYAYWATPRQRRVAETRRAAPTRTAPAAPAVSPEESDEEELRVRLELLQREPEEFPGFQRDIFHFPPVRRPAPPVAAPPPPPVSPTPSAPPLAQTPPLALEEVRRELARFTFLGFLLKGSTRTVFLESSDEIFVVKRGDRFGEENEFLVTGLTPETLTILQRGDERPILVPLVEQAPLVPRTGASAPPFLRPGIGPERGAEPEPEEEPGFVPDIGMPPHPEPGEGEDVPSEEMESDGMPMEGR